jgi:hypothetical protein
MVIHVLLRRLENHGGQGHQRAKQQRRDAHQDHQNGTLQTDPSRQELHRTGEQNHREQLREALKLPSGKEFGHAKPEEEGFF